MSLSLSVSASIKYEVFNTKKLKATFDLGILLSMADNLDFNLKLAQTVKQATKGLI